MQMKGVVTVIEAENEERKSASNSLKLEEELVEADDFEVYDDLSPGAVRTVKLGGHYPAVILDAKPNSEPHMFKAAVFLVPRVSSGRFLHTLCHRICGSLICKMVSSFCYTTYLCKWD